MIEQYNQIIFFIPEIFNETLINDEKEFNNNLQEFANFIAKENNTNSYEIEFRNDIDWDISRFGERKKEYKVLLNSKLLNLYKEYIKNPESIKFQQIINKEEQITLADQLSRFPYQICSGIVHEMEHARQYELLQNNHKEYENVITPLTQDELYHIQKTERDAYRKEFNEVDCLINYFRDNNIDTKNLEKYYKLIQEDFESGFSKGISMLQHAKIINKNLTPKTIEQNKKIYKRIYDFLEKETKFAKERQDHIKNKEDYIIKDINFYGNESKLYIKNDNNKWNVYIESNFIELGFVIEKDKLRLNTLCNKDINQNPKIEEETLKYIKAFTQLHSNKHYKEEISNLLDFNSYKTSQQLIKQNTTKLFHKLKYINKEDINKTYNNLTNLFSIEEKQSLYTAKHINTKEIEIEK